MAGTDRIGRKQMISKSDIYKIYGTDYKEMTKLLLEEAELKSLIPSADTRIGIKPNLVCPTPASYGATTHPEIVSGIIEYLQEHGFKRIIIAEGSWVGDRTSEAYEYCGYRSVCETYGVPFVDTQKEKSHTVSSFGQELSLTNVTEQIDFLINVPVLKGHCQTKITCALKNMKGLLPNGEKRRFHTLGLHKPIAHLSAALKQDFIVTDHICGDLDFEEGGNPVVRNCIMASLDPVLTDSYVCHLLGYTPDEVPYVRLAEKLGSGSTDLNKARFTLLERQDGIVKKECFGIEQDTDERMEGGGEERKILQVSYAVDEVDSCSACYGSLIPALFRLKEEGLLSDLHENIAIGQGHKGKTGRLGVGLCTKDFAYSIKGCPPDEETIYRELKDYIIHHSKS